MDNCTNQPEPTIAPGSAEKPPRRAGWPWPRLWAIAMVTFRQGWRSRLWLLVPPAIVVLVLADATSERFDPIFEAVPAAISTSLLVMTVLAVILGLFFSTYSLPSEMESKIVYSVVTKPVSHAEIVGGKTLGLSLLVLATVALTGLGAYIYIHVRASGIRAVAQARLVEAEPRAAFPSDLNALRGVADGGALRTARYLPAAGGPQIRVDLGPDHPLPPDTLWALGDANMRLTWNLQNAPVRQWVADGEARLRLKLDIVRPPDAKPDEKVGVGVFLPPRQSVATEPNLPQDQMPVYQAAFEVSADGVVEIMLAAPTARAAPGILNLPASGDLVLEVAPLNPGYAVGAGANSLQLVHRTGQVHTFEKAPELTLPDVVRRWTLAGHGSTPRQMVVYHFENVPAEALGEGDAVIEAGFSLDVYAPPTVQPVAEATLVRQDGQRRSIRFTPDGHHSALLRIDKEFWHGGSLEAHVEFLTDDDFLGVLPESLRLRIDGGPFVWNFTKAILQVWLFGTLLAAAGIMVSTRVSWFVGILAVTPYFIAGAAYGFVNSVEPFVYGMTILWVLLLAGGLVYVLFFERAATRRSRVLQALLCMGVWLTASFVLSLGYILHFGTIPLRLVPVPDFTAILPTQGMAMGQVISGVEMGQSFCLTAVCTAVMLVMGALSLKSREVAA
jgi:hypothetical protein